MPISIGKKKIKGQYYYFARESKRIDGKPRIVFQKYLGKAQRIISAVEQLNTHPIVSELTISEFGAVAALYDIASRLDIIRIINKYIPKREQGLSVGHYMLIAAINRCVCPKSKAKIGDWFATTPLRRLTPAKKKQLNSKRFWDNMTYLDEKTIQSIEQELTRKLIQEFQVDTRCLLFDSTNFFTFIDSFNEAPSLAQRGNSKEKRKNLRIIGLALLVSVDFGIPLFHDTYPGNRPDAKEFESITERIVSRYKTLSNTVENITIVFDKGNNSQDNMTKVDASPYHFVGSLKLNQCPELTDIKKEWFEPLRHPKLYGVTAFRFPRKMFGENRTVVVTHNEQLFLAQSQSLLNEIRKRTKNLNDLGKKLTQRRVGQIKRGRIPSVKSVEKQVHDILKGQYVKEIVRVTVTEKEGLPELNYCVDRDALNQIFSERLGKTILFTDNHEWTTEEIILAYRGQTGIEDCFKTMKNPHFVSWGPMYHWTDHNIRVHAFYCVIALLIVSLLQRELFRSGIAMPVTTMLEELNKIQEVAITYEGPGFSKKPDLKLSKMTKIQQQLYDVLDLKRFLEF